MFMFNRHLKVCKIHYLVRNRFLIYLILLNFSGNKNKLYIQKYRKIKLLKQYLNIIFNVFFISKILRYNDCFFLNIIDSKVYLVKLYSVINNKWNKFNNLPEFFLTKQNTYFFWYFFNQDSLINIFINLTMKNGKKNISYKNVYKSFFFLKKIVGINPLLFLKRSLYNNRFLFDIKHLTLRKKIITMPQLLSVKSQLVKSVKFILNNCYLKSWKINKKTICFYKKITYLLLNNFFNENKLNNIIKEETLLVKHNFSTIKKENLFKKYVTQISDLVKKPLFKLKYVSTTKKMKILKSRSNLLRKVKGYIDFNQIFLLNRYKTNLQSKKKLKSKWFL